MFKKKKDKELNNESNNKSLKKKEKKQSTKKKSAYEKQLEDVQKELDNLVEDMRVVMGDDVPKIRVADIAKKKLTKKDYINSLIELVLSIILLVALRGYFVWFDYSNIFYVFIMFGGIVLIETLLNILIKRFMIRIYIYSIGLIKIVPAILAYILACFFAPGITVLSVGLAILVFVIYYIAKVVTMFFVEGKRIRVIRR